MTSLRFAAIALFGFLPTYLLRFSLGPLPMTVLEIFVLGVVALWAVQGGWRKLPVLRPYAAPIGMLLVASVIAVAVAPDTLAALGVWRAYIAEPLLVFAVLVTTFTRDDWCKAGMALAASGVAIALLGIAQKFSGLGIPSPWDIERRVTSIYDFPNAVGLFLAPIVAMLVVWGVHHFWSDRTVSGVMALLMGSAIVLAKTEAALAAIPAALVITLWLTTARLRTKIIATTAVAAVGIVAFAGLPAVREKILLNDVSGQARIAMWREATTMLADHPLTGAGLSGFPTALIPYHDPTFFEIFQYPHNVILNIWSELGLLGVVTLVVIAAIVCRHTWQHRNDPMILAAFAALLTMVIHGLVDVPFFKNDLAIMTAGLLAFLAYKNTAPEGAVRRTSR